MKKICTILLLLVFIQTQNIRAQITYAEKLGYPKGAKVVILHVDDVGMSFDSNEGAIRSMTEGVANSCSIMMTCPWVPGYLHYVKENPTIDAGLHLTLTSEWKDYRWGPLTGKSVTPGLVDSEYAFYPSVNEVVLHASAEEVYTEIKAQLNRAKTMGFTPTHLDSHMGTLFAIPSFLEKYIMLGIENNIPVMMPGGRAKLIQQQTRFPDAQMEQLRMLGSKLWNAGLPVLDDLFNESYEWKIADDMADDSAKLQKFKTSKYIEAIQAIEPGITMIIMHCTDPTEVFGYISDSGPTRRGDMLAMIDPAFKKALQDEKIILTTWRELKQRRDKVK